MMMTSGLKEQFALPCRLRRTFVVVPRLPPRVAYWHESHE